MRLSTHLWISHSIPVVVVTLALALALGALVRISMILTTLTSTELVLLREQGTLHRAAWSLDVAMRHGHAACRDRSASAEVAPRIASDASALRTLVAASNDGPMRALAQGYLATADEVLSGDACSALLGEHTQLRRAELDEQLTNLWVDRLEDLHAAVTKKDESARTIAVSTTWLGIPLAAGAFLLAMWIARRMARIVNRPLARLASMAERVGTGDFQSTVRVVGPAEVLALGQSLERMRARLEELEALKQGFLASVSHELRTPLSSIREALALLEDGAVGNADPRQARVIRIARAACEREIRLVTKLLDLSRLRAGSPIQRTEGVSMDGVLQAALAEERAEANDRGVTLELVATGPHPLCNLDPILVERAVANVVRNAVTVSRRGQRVTVERQILVDSPGRSGRWVRVRCSDQGPGVPAEIRRTLFEPFVTRPVPTSDKAFGIGLGLALAREVAIAHGGTLELVEHDGRGTQLDLWLPVESVIAEDEIRAQRARAEPDAKAAASA